MTEGGTSLILGTLMNSDQMFNKYLLKVSNKDTEKFKINSNVTRKILTLFWYFYC